MSRALLAALLVSALAWLTPQRAAAYAELRITVADGPGEGFNDNTPVDPIGGNTGTTLGQQRLKALQYACDLWGQAIDSEQVIRIEATYDPIECVGGFSTTLAVGGTTYVDFVPTDDGELVYPTALADRIAGEDLHPSDADVSITFNVNVDSGTCLTGVRWYYGFDGNPGTDTDMIDTALHEIAHGLGVQALYESETGTLINDTPSAFLTHVLDLDVGKHWDEMTTAERLVSQENAWRVVWSGSHASEMSSDFFVGGRPSVHSAQVPTLSGFAADASHGTWAVATTVSGELAADTTGACPPANVNGRVALLPWDCAHSSWAASVEAEGAIAVLVESPGDWDIPVGPLEEPMPEAVGIPVVAISTADFTRFIDAAAMGTVTVELSIDEDQLLGADEDGRVMLNVTRPQTASSISHFEPLARPNLLMEPITAPRTLHDLDITPALLHDLGWAPFCGNGDIDQEEECDDAQDNSDTVPDACRTTCVAAHCGDGILDDGEACDDGEDNSDTLVDACRTTCVVAFCGDGVIDADEACDDGEDNSDTGPSACRSTCVEPRCGDDVMDTGEGCDDGARNSDTAPNACRLVCKAASCGDGVLDQGEACDDGARNGDTASAACRTDCAPPIEVDPNTTPDGGMVGGGAGNGAGDNAPGSASDGDEDDGGCGCRVVGAQPSQSHGGNALLVLLGLGSVLATRRRRAPGSRGRSRTR